MKKYEITMDKMIRALLDEKKYSSLKDVLVTMNPVDIALTIEKAGEKHAPLIFRLLPKDLAAETFVEMNSEIQELLIQGFSDEELQQVLIELYTDDAVDIIEEMPASVVKRILKNTPGERREVINEILRFPEDSAGSIMTTEYISLRPGMTIGEAIKHIRSEALNSETVYTLYVTESRKLLGFVSLKDILLTLDDSIKVSEIMDKGVKFVSAYDKREEVANTLSKYDFLAIPVVDREDRMIGIVTFDDAMDVLEEEATEDIELIGGMNPSEKSYAKAGVTDLFKQRIPWLMLLMVSATFTGMIINGFENALAAQVALTAFIPMLMDTGGNSGSQSSVTIIRALSLGEISFRDLPKVMFKEAKTAVLCGIVLAVCCFVKIVLIDKMILGNQGVTVMVAFVVCLAMAITVLIAKIIGCTLPMCAKKLGFDPAVMASPFITTIVDALSLLVFFGLASVVLMR